MRARIRRWLAVFAICATVAIVWFGTARIDVWNTFDRGYSDSLHIDFQLIEDPDPPASWCNPKPSVHRCLTLY